MRVLASGKEQITLYYGNQTLNGKPYYHTGIDMVKKTNSLDYIVAAQKGKVTKVVKNVKGRDLNKGYGNYVELEHANGIKTKYCHMKYGSITVKKGDIVEKGKVLGYMSDTGYTFGAHLHFGMTKDNKTINPLAYIKDEKQIDPYGTVSKSENYVVIVPVLTVRRGPGTNYGFIRYVDLTKDEKYQMSKHINYKANGYVKGMEFTALEITKKANEAWARTPSGWVCLYNKDGKYCEKI